MKKVHPIEAFEQETLKLAMTPLAKREKMSDIIKKPAHYNFGKYEVIDVIEDWGVGYHLGNVVKYVARAPHKGEELQDLKKALWYLQRHIKNMESKP